MVDPVKLKYCVDGEWAESGTGSYMPVTDSSTGELIAQAPACTARRIRLPQHRVSSSGCGERIRMRSAGEKVRAGADSGAPADAAAASAPRAVVLL